LSALAPHAGQSDSTAPANGNLSEKGKPLGLSNQTTVAPERLQTDRNRRKDEEELVGGRLAARAAYFGAGVAGQL
jgi:hypothetical protein